MDTMQPQGMVAQAKDIPNVIRSQMSLYESNVRAALSADEMKRMRRLWLVGSGDSYHASRAVELFFEKVAGIQVEPFNSQLFLDYGADYIPRPSERNIVVAISASGRSVRVVSCIEKARAAGNMTIALSGATDQPVPLAAERVIHAPLPPFTASPGVRNYIATLLSLYLLGIAMGEARGKIKAAEAASLREELLKTADVIEATLKAVEGKAGAVVNAIKDAQIMLFLGSGPSFATAMFSAAKLVENAAVFSASQDLEEWAHVEGMAYPNDIPTFIIAPPGLSYWRAAEVAKAAAKRQRRVIAVVQDGDTEVAGAAQFVLPVMGAVREEFSPLVYETFSYFIAMHLAEELGRKPFQRDNTEMWKNPDASGGIRPAAAG
ncbi:MAG: SIS domain-containing protein [Anaerolineae bacterium]|nr:SIS domain-containing protein [Anaerolineae bacterium]